MPTTFEDLDREIKRRELAAVLARLGRKYLIVSGKGGVGKTTAAVNLAWLLAGQGKRVGLLDIDLHGPDLAAALYCDSPITADGQGRLVPVEAAPGLYVLTIQHLLTDPRQAVMWRGPRKIRAIGQFLGETAWPELDYFLIDSPPGTGDEALTVINHIKDLTALVITTGHPLSISDVYKAVSCLKQSKTKILGLVENQSALICPECSRLIELYPPENVLTLAGETGLEVLARLPWDPAAARRAEEVRRPLAAACPDSPAALILKELAQKL
ncbi:MAG: Mrp/NBP35 family ATP-binding protein [Deltaproteobacteria bacterium]|jgi:Mrp family chromosome partitioning ATPase|nr:Mrp/NBP35 family ATP-binding protein [Deltaproteobacteria bacterium]